MTDGKCIEYTDPPSSNPTVSPTTPSAEPTRAPTTEYGARFTITYQYTLRTEKPEESRGSNISYITEAVTSSTEDFVDDSVDSAIYETKGTHESSCDTSSDFAVSINETTQMVAIHGTVYTCDNETLLELIDNMIENSTLHLRSETLEILDHTVQIMAEVINELEVSSPSPTLEPTLDPTEDWKSVIEEELEKEKSTFIYMMGGLGCMICCCVMAFCFLFTMNAKKDWKRNAEEDAVTSKSRSNSNAEVVRGYMITNTVKKEQSENTAKNVVPVYVDSEEVKKDQQDQNDGIPKLNHCSVSRIMVPQSAMVKVESKENSLNDEFEVIGDDMMTPGQIEETPGDVWNEDDDSK